MMEHPETDPAVLQDSLRSCGVVVFDLDGTLYDTRDFERPALAAVADWVRERSGLPLDGLTEAFWRRRESDRHRPGLFDELLAERGLPAAWGGECVRRFHDHPGEELRTAPSLLPQLEALRSVGTRLALVSNGRPRLQQRKLNQLRMNHIFDVSIYCDPGEPARLKPSAWAWSELATWREGKPATHVGDDPVDRDFALAGAATFVPFSFRSSRYAG